MKTIDSEQAMRAFTDLFAMVPASAPERVWFHEAPGIMAMVTGVPFATLNGVFVLDEQADVDQAATLLKTLPHARAPYSLQVPIGLKDRFAGVAAEMAMMKGPDIPLMTAGTLPAYSPPGELTIRKLEPAEFPVRAHIAAEAFEEPVEAITDGVSLFSRIPGYRVYVGEVDGNAVTTAISVPTADSSVSIGDVATLRAHRGHGYGAAITAHVMRDGFDDGATWAWLQSSEEGYGVYERLGFRTVHTWALWVALP